MTTKPLPCSDCDGAVASLVKDEHGTIRLVIWFKKHSQRHSNSFTLDELKRWWREFEEESKQTADARQT